MLLDYILFAAIAYWVYRDAKTRKNNAIGWSLGTFIIGPIVLPVYLAKRNLKAGEVREGGTAWNILRYFAIFWTLAVAIAIGGGLLNASNMAQHATSEVEHVGMVIGTGIGVGLLVFIWFIVLVAALVLGMFLKKTSVIEKGPTGALALGVPETRDNPLSNSEKARGV